MEQFSEERLVVEDGIGFSPFGRPLCGYNSGWKVVQTIGAVGVLERGTVILVFFGIRLAIQLTFTQLIHSRRTHCVTEDVDASTQSVSKYLQQSNFVRAFTTNI